MIAVKILAVLPDRFSASIKQAQPELDPWRDAEQLVPGSEHNGTVVAVMDWGASIELDLGPTGVVLCEHSATETPIKRGGRVRAVVIACDPETRRLELRVAQKAKR